MRHRSSGLLLLIGSSTAFLACLGLLLGTVVIGKLDEATLVNAHVADARRHATGVDELANQVLLSAREPAGALNTPALLERRGAVLIAEIRELDALAGDLPSTPALLGTSERIERLEDAADGMVRAGVEALAADDPAARAEALAVLDVVYRLFRHDLAEFRGSLTTIETEALTTQTDGIGQVTQWILVAAVLAGTVALLAGVAGRRVAEREQNLIAKLGERATTDALTGLLNRRGLRDLLGDRLGEWPADAAALLYLDLDRFKQINDSMGHAVGDQLLRTVADRISSAVRDDDLIARLGGDEFAVLVGQGDGAQDAVAIARRLRDRIAMPVHLDGHRIEVEASIGIRRIDPAETDVEDLLRDADVAMYTAKRERDGGIRLFDAGLIDAVRERQGLEEALRAAVRGEGLDVHHQPIVDLDGRVVGTEALVRWFRDGQMVGPDRFLPIAVELGLMTELDDQVMRRATKNIAEVNRTFGTELRVAVNLAAEELDSEGLRRRVCAALEASGLPAHLLTIEVTEQGALRSIDRATGVLAAVRALGVRTALDDFGTGHSSLSYLDRLPLDTLKIDRSFLPVRDDDLRRHQLFGSVVELGNRLGFDVVAEGIETDDQLTLAGAAGCAYVQGYHTGRPGPIGALVERLRADLAALDAEASDETVVGAR